MSPSEIGFLALGIAFGSAAGVALLAVVRPRSPLRPVVKVTVTPYALLPPAVAASMGRLTGADVPLRGSPDDDAQGGPVDAAPPTQLAAARPTPSAGAGTRTNVPTAEVGLPPRTVAIPIVGGARPPAGTLVPSAPPVAAVALAGAERRGGSGTGVDVGPGAAGLAVIARAPLPEPRPALGSDPVAVPIVAGRAPSGDPGAAVGASGTAALDACADERTRASAACADAETARDAARSLADRHRETQRAYDELQARIDEATALADPRRLAAEKERLHDQFRTAHGPTASADEAEAAARDWLSAVSAANKAAREAARRVQAGTEEVRRSAATLEKLDLEANAARITAERAEDDCRAAREALAACEERQRIVAPSPGEEPSPLDAHWPGGPEPALDRGPGPQPGGGSLPVILLVLRGDAAAREALVASLAAGDAAATARWHVRIADFVDAVTARAIEDGYLDTDAENPFWRLFDTDEQREIVLALSALGFRFDGMGGFADDRVPSARDLSLAVGYAGLDRMRIRTWPGESALARLFGGATVRADLWLATQAEDLSLARVEAALGPRAAALGELWDAWGRVRPAMLEERGQ